MSAVPNPDWLGVVLQHRRARAHQTTALALGLSWLLVVGVLGWLALMTVLSHLHTTAALMLAAFVLLPAVGLWLVARAGATGGTPLVLMVVAIVVLSDTTARGYASGIDAQSVIKFGIWTAGLLLLFWRWPVVAAALRQPPTAALLLLSVWAMLTAVYSVTPFYTFGAGLSFVGICVTAYCFAADASPRRGLMVVTCSLMAALALSLLLYVLVPSQVMTAHENGRSMRLSGVFGSPNNLGVAAALALLMVFLLCRQLGAGAALVLALLGLVISGACLMLSGSRTAIFSMLAGIAVVVFTRRPLLAVSVITLLFCAGLLFVLAPDAREAMLALVAREGSTREVTTFTGRTDIWRHVWSLIERAPVLGYGFASTKVVIPAGFAGAFGWTTHSAHNMLLQSWVATGLVGLSLLLVAFATLVRAHFTRPHPVRDAVTAFVLVQGLMESSVAGPTINMVVFIFLWATALGCQPDPAPPRAASDQGRGRWSGDSAKAPGRPQPSKGRPSLSVPMAQA
jgi:O-antigen ligase